MLESIVIRFIQDTSQARLDAELTDLSDDLNLFCLQPNLDPSEKAEAIREHRVAVQLAYKAHDERMQGWQ